MGGGSTKTKSTTTQTMPVNQQRNVDTLLQGALDYFNSGGRNFYEGDLIADFNPNQIAGQGQMINYAQGAGQDFVNAALRGNQFFMDPKNIFNPDNIPGFKGNVDALTRGYTQNLTENILPHVRAGGTNVGQFGGSAMGIGEALGIARSNKGLTDSLSNLYLGAYGQGLDSFNQAQNRAPSMFALGAAPGQLVNQVGGQQQEQEQREIQADVARHEFDENEQMLLLTLLRDLTGQMGTYGGTTTQKSKQATSQSPISTALGGALSLASLWNPTASLFSGLKSGGSAAGAAASGIPSW